MNSKNVLNIKYDNLINNLSDIDILSTFNKICLAQNLLKEMNSFKERFDDNKNKMIDEIGQNCFKFYKKKIMIKEIYDNFDSNNLDKYINYNVVNNPESVLEKDIYNSIYNFIFLIRNSYSSLMKMINYCDAFNAKNLSYFFIHLFYEDISSCSFLQEELLIFSFFVFNKFINKTMPNKLEYSNNFNNASFYSDFSYFIIKLFLKKIDIRNYFSSFIKDLLTKIEDYNDNLSPDLIIISNKLGILLEDLNIKRESDLVEDFDNKKGCMELKKRIKSLIDNSNSLLDKKIKEKMSQIDSMQEKANSIKSNKNMPTKEDFYKLDPFFEKENISLPFLFEKLTFYQNMKNKNDIDFALVYYFENIVDKIINQGEPVDLFSNILLKNNLITTRFQINAEKYSKITSNFILNYDFIISFINILLLKIKDNTKTLPRTLKIIFKTIDELFKRKYSSEKKNLYNFNLLFLKARLYIGGMIIPSLSNVDSIGIFPDKITSKLAKDNMKVIVEILNKAISGNLFLADEIGFTIFNKFIIDTIPVILDIANSLNKDCNLPNFINKLFSGKNTDYYDYFKEKNEQNIQYQTICISLKEINILLNIIEKNKTVFIDNNKNEDTRNILGIFLRKKEKYLSIYEEKKKKNVIDYYIFNNIKYKQEFEERIKAIIQDSFEIFFGEQKNDIVLKFKKCLSAILAYINYLQNEDFISLIKRKEDIDIMENKKINDYYKYKKNLIYNETTFNDLFKTKKMIKKLEVKTQDDLAKIKKGLKKIGGINASNPKKVEKVDRFFMQRKSIIRSSITNIKEEIDFKSKILPKIESKVYQELYIINSNKKEFHRIVFCVSFIEEHIKDLPVKYTQNNFKNIINEIIQENIFMIKELRNNILNTFYDKKRNSEKLNTILNKDFEQAKIMERFSYVGRLLNKIILKGNLIVNIEGNIIKSIKLNLKEVNDKNINIDTIDSFIDKIPKLIHFIKENDLFEFHKKVGFDEVLKSYLNELKNLVINEEIMSRFSEEEYPLIIYELENYILYKLHEKIFPIIYTKDDVLFYNKCCRLDFVKPENVIKDKKNINKKLLDTAVDYLKEIDKKRTPLDKLRNFGNAIDIIRNSITFNSGKADLGLDDTLSFIIYIVLKSKLKNIFTTLNYCTNYINQELSKKYYGSLLTQFAMVTNIIKDMKYTDLINVTKEQFGQD